MKFDRYWTLKNVMKCTTKPDKGDMSEIQIPKMKKSGPSADEKKTLLRILWGKIRQVDRDVLDLDKVYFLKKNPFFENLNKNQLIEVAKLIYERDYLTNEFVFEVGQPGAALFIIQSGEISIETPALPAVHPLNSNQPTEASQIAVLGKASFFGELALLNDDPRSASARALVPTKIFALFQKDLDQLAEKSPEITSQIFKALATVIGRRLKATNEFFDKKLRSVA